MIRDVNLADPAIIVAIKILLTVIAGQWMWHVWRSRS